MLVAYHLAKNALPEFSSKFSRKDFSKPQLFACLVLKEFEKKDYRGVEQLLWDWPEARRAIGLAKAPDHTTLHRAAKALFSLPRARKLLDQLVVFARTCRVLASRWRWRRWTPAALRPATSAATSFAAGPRAAWRKGRKDAGNHLQPLPQAGHRRRLRDASDPVLLGRPGTWSRSRAL